MHYEKDIKIGVVGLGYVGLPLAIEFGKLYETFGYDINPTRVRDLRDKIDRTRELAIEEFELASNLVFTHTAQDLAHCNFYIVTVPTPIDRAKRPDLGPLLSACELVGSFLKHGDIVVFESTVYPGATEEDCVPVLERVSGLRYNKDFYCGYSPERINPGDYSHRITSIVKVTSGSTPEAALAVDKLYASIIPAGTHLAPSIAVAEAAKVIENTQRDVNIALINELSIIFNRIGIDTSDVLAAAATKWNFLSFTPGLVGGHCIGVDPYYLTQKAESVGYYPQVILSGRRINDFMGEYVASQLVKCMIQKSMRVDKSRVLIMGLTFKENCPDIRNTKVVDVINHLESFGIEVDVFDPWVAPEQALDEYDIEMCQSPTEGFYDAIILAVPHKEFKNMGPSKIHQYGKHCHILFDLKSAFAAKYSDMRL